MRCTGPRECADPATTSSRLSAAAISSRSCRTFVTERVSRATRRAPRLGTCSPASPPSPSTASPHAGSPSRSICAPAFPASPSSAAATPPCGSRASACTPRVRNSGFEFPNRRVTVNLAPAYLPKSGPGLRPRDGVRPARRQRPGAGGARRPLGGLRRALPRWRAASVRRGARRRRGCAAPRARRTHRPARVRGGGRRSSTGSPSPEWATSRGVAAILRGDPPPELPPAPSLDARGRRCRGPARRPRARRADPRADDRGCRRSQRAARRPAGNRQDDARAAARRDPAAADAARRRCEVTRIHSLAGLRRGGGASSTERPFRAPHHTISSSGLVGGGAHPGPGEASLAHHGVLFLDELSEFARSALEALRQPLEDRQVTIVRGQRAALLPTSFMLVAATNPCPCGRGSRACECTTADHNRHRRRLSGPLLDRIDLHVGVERPDEPMLTAPPLASSAAVREEVLAARERQAARLQGTGASCNADMPQAARTPRLGPASRRARGAARRLRGRDAERARPRSRAAGRPHHRRPRGPRAHRGPARARSDRAAQIA